MDEACGGIPETSTLSENVTASGAQSTPTTDEGAGRNGREREKLLEEELGRLRVGVYVLENKKQQTISEIIQALREGNHKLETQVTSWKAKNDELKNEVRKLKIQEAVEKEKLALAIEEKKEDDFVNIYASSKSSHEEWKSRRAVHQQPIEYLNSWRGIVGDKPEIIWSIDDFSHHRINEREFAVPQYGLRCKVRVIPDTPAPGQERTIPTIELSVQFDDDDDDEGDFRGKPMVFSMIAGRNSRGEEEWREERLDVARAEGGRYYYERTLQQKPPPHHCVSLTIYLWFELPWSAREVQSEDGVLFWTVDNLPDVLSLDLVDVYSPRFLTAGVGGYRLQAVLYVTADDWLHLLLIRRCPFVPLTDISDYVVSVTILMPNCQPNKVTKPRSTNFRNGESFILGQIQDLIVDNNFLCRVKVVGQKN